MSIARQAAAYAAVSALLAVFTIALIAALPGANAWAASHPGGLSARNLEPEEPIGGEGEEGEEAAPRKAMLVHGRAIPPRNAPRVVRRVINAANRIRSKPYVWGGGHARWWDRGYDCSGSVSFALFGGGLIPRPLTSGELEGWGAPGPGKWITVYANAHHTFAEIAGLRWDTVGDAKGTGPRWHLATTSTAGFVARHPPGF